MFKFWFNKDNASTVNIKGVNGTSSYTLLPGETLFIDNTQQQRKGDDMDYETTSVDNENLRDEIEGLKEVIKRQAHTIENDTHAMKKYQEKNGNLQVHIDNLKIDNAGFSGADG